MTSKRRRTAILYRCKHIQNIWPITILLALLFENLFIETVGHEIPQNKTVGGEEATPNEFPFMAALSRNRRFRCGATILSPQWILTAGHCVNNATAAQLNIIVGSHDLRNLSVTAQIMTIMRFFRHPGYDDVTLKDDIALLQLTTDLIFGDAVKAVNLAPQGYIINPAATLIGWGQEVLNGTTKPRLQKLTAPVVDHDTCNEIFMKERIKITDELICIGGEDKKGTCSGDSGGPAICTSPCNVGFVQCGIASFGFPDVECGTEGAPEVFTRVTSYLDYIINTIAENSRPNAAPDTVRLEL